METAKMSDRGQVVIPKSAREELGVEDGTTFVVGVVDGAVVLQPLDTEKLLEEFERIREESGWLSEEEIIAEIRAYRQEKADRRA